MNVAKELKALLSNLKSLNSIDIRGDAEPELHIKVDDKKLEAYGIPKESFYKAISNLSSIYPAGTFKQRGSQFFISTQNGKKEVKALEETIIGVGNRRVRVKDVAEVKFELSTPKEISHFNGVQNISLNLTKTEEGNAIALSKQIKDILRNFSRKYPNITFEAIQIHLFGLKTGLI